MIYKSRALRSLWTVKIYDGDPDKKKTRIREETIVAFNAVEAIRKCPGNVAEQPERVCYVTFPEKDGYPIHRIENTAGPTEEVIEPSIPLEDDDWG